MDMRRRLIRTCAAGVAAGAAGTSVMTVTARLHREAAARRQGVAPSELTHIVDYDDSEHVIIAAGALLDRVVGVSPRTESGKRALFLLVHWGYGSAVGLGHAGLHHVFGREPEAGLAFFLGCQVMALGLFPVLGDTPVPWKWERRLLVTSIVQHGIYAGAVAAADVALRNRAARSVLG